MYIDEKVSDAIYQQIVEKVTHAGYTIERQGSSIRWQVNGSDVLIDIGAQHRPYSLRAGKTYIQIRPYYITNSHSCKNFPQKNDGSFNWTKIVDAIVDAAKKNERAKEYNAAIDNARQKCTNLAKELGINFWEIKPYGGSKYTLSINLTEDQLRKVVAIAKQVV